MSNIVETAERNGNFKTLVTAFKQADLVETLSGPGPFTVFAPTDQAFNKLPPETVPSLLRDKEMLKSVLTYHVVRGKHLAADVSKQHSLKTVQGQLLIIQNGTGVTVNDATIVRGDIVTDNGVIHVIDNVVLPEPEPLRR